MDLIRCIQTGSVGEVKKLLDLGAAVNAKKKMGSGIPELLGPTTPLITAAIGGNVEIVDLLLRRGARLEATTTAWFRHRRVFAIELDCGFQGHENNAFTAALAMGHDDVAAHLVKAMANPEAVEIMTFYSRTSSRRDNTFLSALDLAALCFQPDLIRLLVKQGADPNRMRNPQEGTPLHILLNAYYKEEDVDDDKMLATVMALLECGADPWRLKACPCNHSHPSECGEICAIVPCTSGFASHCKPVHQHFWSLAHRQICDKPACVENRRNYAVSLKDIPGHCEVDYDRLFFCIINVQNRVCGIERQPRPGAQYYYG